MSEGFNFKAVLDRAARMKKDLPLVIANTAQNYFVRSFTEQGFDGGVWQEVNRRIPGTPEYKYPKFKELSRRTTPILVRSGRLRRSVSNSIKSATWETIRLVAEAPGALRHNEGLDGMPRRHFMGNSPILDKEIDAKIKKYMDKIW